MVAARIEAWVVVAVVLLVVAVVEIESSKHLPYQNVSRFASARSSPRHTTLKAMYTYFEGCIYAPNHEDGACFPQYLNDPIVAELLNQQQTRETRQLNATDGGFMCHCL